MVASGGAGAHREQGGGEQGRRHIRAVPPSGLSREGTLGCLGLVTQAFVKFFEF